MVSDVPLAYLGPLLSKPRRSENIAISSFHQCDVVEWENQGRTVQLQIMCFGSKLWRNFFVVSHYMLML